MKKLTYILFASVMILTGCTEDFDINDNVQDINAEFIPGKYVAFNAPGANVTLDPEEAAEDDGSVEFEVEVPTGSVSDVTVNYSLSGTAVFGTDFTIAGASGAGGSVVIQHDPDAPDAANLIDHADLVVDLLTDGVADGDKTLTITLVSASSADGALLVGRAGSAILTSAVVNIADID